MGKKKVGLEELKSLSKEDLLRFITEHLKEEGKIEVKKDRLPISIFDNKELSALETICKYLKEELGFSYHEIASILNRDDRTVWSTYNNSVKKRKNRLIVKEDVVFVPLPIFSDRKLSVLENLVSYLKDKIGYNYHQIAVLLNRDDRTVWTVYNRAMKK